MRKAKKIQENILKTVEKFEKICYNRFEEIKGDLFECPTSD